jgi:hypothetical protein
MNQQANCEVTVMALIGTLGGGAGGVGGRRSGGGCAV